MTPTKLEKLVSSFLTASGSKHNKPQFDTDQKYEQSEQSNGKKVFTVIYYRCSTIVRFQQWLFFNLWKIGYSFHKIWYMHIKKVKVRRKEQVGIWLLIYPHYSHFQQKVTYDEGLSSGKVLFYINASVTPNCKWIGHIPFGSHLGGGRALNHMSHSDCGIDSLSWTTYHMLL